MFAVVFSYQSDPSQVETDMEFVKHVVVPDNQQSPGFKGLHMLVDRQTGRSLGIGYWENEADARATAEHMANPPQHPAGVEAPAISNITIETYEVLITIPVA